MKTEDKLRVGVPLVRGPGNAAAAQTQAVVTVVTTREAEDVRVAAPVTNLLHRDIIPVIHRLIHILQTFLRTDFGWAKLKTELCGPGVDFGR